MEIYQYIIIGYSLGILAMWIFLNRRMFSGKEIINIADNIMFERLGKSIFWLPYLIVYLGINSYFKFKIWWHKPQII
jgi:hypothetical protein